MSGVSGRSVPTRWACEHSPLRMRKVAFSGNFFCTRALAAWDCAGGALCSAHSSRVSGLPPRAGSARVPRRVGVWHDAHGWVWPLKL